MNITKRLCVKPGIQERGTECGQRGEWGECCIPGNVAKHEQTKCTETYKCHHVIDHDVINK